MNSNPSQQAPAGAMAERALAPDLARGIMLALIAVANVMIYLYDRPYGIRGHIVEEGAADRAVTAFMVMTVDARAYPLFAALFGYGLVRIARRFNEHGLDDGSVRARVRRRSLWLLVFGFVHAALAFSGDILGWYGLLGMIMASFLGSSDRALLRFAAIWLVLASALQGFVYSDPRISDQRSFLWSFAIEDPVRAAGWRLVEWIMTPFGMLAVVSALLVGVWAGRRQLLEHPRSHITLLKRTATIGIGAGVVGGAGMALISAHLWLPPYPVIALLSWLHILSGVLCGLGYAALITLAAIWLEDRYGRQLPPAIGALRSTGARSLSCYLAQTVVFAALLPPFTLGLGAVFGTTEAALLGLATWLATVLLATLAERHGIRGPAEVLLRRLGSPGRNEPARAIIR